MRLCAQAAQAQHDSSFFRTEANGTLCPEVRKSLAPESAARHGWCGSLAILRCCGSVAAWLRQRPRTYLLNLSGTRLCACAAVAAGLRRKLGWQASVHCRHCRGRLGRRRAICEGTGASQLPGRVWAFGVCRHGVNQLQICEGTGASQLPGRVWAFGVVDMVSTSCKFCPEVRKMKGSTVRSGQQLMGAISTSGHHGTIGAHARLSA